MIRSLFAAVPQSFSVAPAQSSSATLADRLAAAIKQHNVPGASAAVFRMGQWEAAAAGIANGTAGVPLTPDTVMHVGSVTKLLTATLVMQFVDEGRIELRAPLRRYLPNFRVADRSANEHISVEMLLNHSSGIDGEGGAASPAVCHHATSDE